MNLPNSVKLVEVGPRDGLQNEAHHVHVDAKVELINLLSDSGLSVVEAGAFVSPKWVPQMADTAQVMANIKRRAATTYPVLVPNMKGFEAALAAGVEEIAIFGAASETFSQKNINCSIKQSIERFEPVCEQAIAHNIRIRGYVSCVLGCPYEGEIKADAVAEVAARFMELGCYEISLGDTIGVGTPGRAQLMVDTVASIVPVEKLAAHFHDTYGQALSNIFAVMQTGIATVDSSVAGLGGCPYARGASGNVASEDVLYMLDGLGIETGVDMGTLLNASRFICGVLGRAPTSKAALALQANRE